MKWINYHHLIYFKEIATLGSISKASEKLKVGQPALSSQLKYLEEYLGVNLFERKNRKLVLTQAGKIALEYANQISELGQELLQVIDRKAFSSNLKLSFGALDGIPKHLISDIVDFAQKKTGCFLSIFEDSSENLLKELNNHQIDIILTDHEINAFDNRNVFSKKIISKTINCYGSIKFKNLKDNFPYSLENAPVILPTKHSKIRSDMDHFFHLKKIRPKFSTETQDTALQKLLAQKGDGVIFLPDFAAKELIKEKKIIKLGQIKELTIEYFLIYNKKVIENPVLDLILNQDFEKMRLGL